MKPVPTLGNEKPSSPKDADLLSSFSTAEVFDRKYSHVIEVDEALKPNLLGWSTGGPLLDQLAEYMVRNGKKCHIVAGEAASSFNRASVVSDGEIFLTLMCERRTKGENYSGNDSTDLGELERKIMTLLQTLDSENVVALEQEYVAEASDVDTVIWNVQNNRRMEEPPEYVIDVQKSGQEDLVIRVLKREGDKYAVKVDQMMSLFVASSDENIADGYDIQQILQRVEGMDTPSGSDGSEAPTIPVSAVISRGFCLTIPDVGTILLSPEGSVAIGGITTEKSMYVSSPMDVTVSNSNVQQMEVVANHMNVTRLEGDVGEISEIGTLHFHPRGSSSVSEATLSVMAGAHLKARDMFIEGAEMVNLGRLSISNEANWNGGNIANYGILEADTTGSMVVFDGISHLFNQESGVIHSHGQLIISSAMACNVGTIDVSVLDMVMAGAMENYGIIHSHGRCSISCCDSIYNRKVIDSGGDLEIRTNSLNNDRGRIISRRKANFIVRDRIDNHGNCLVDHDVPEKVEYYTPLSSDRAWRKGPPGSGVDTQRNIIENKRDVYGWDPDNTSTITSYGDMVVSVTTGDFDNSFGSLCALSGISINAHDGNVVNENGRIFVRGRAVFTGKNFRNGYVKGDRIFSGQSIPHEVDPEVVIGLAGYGQNIDVSSILDKIGPTGLYPFVKGEEV
ncbi:MAG: hypothetical protein LBC30_02355, partial [Puniceicoccales bacterium]|nr:hypothetical protein [Puniceicoccales bacterium]